MKYFFIVFSLLFSLATYGQDSLATTTRTRTYVPVKQYLAAGNNLTKEDSLNFMVHANDTLVLIREGFRAAEEDKNKVRVEYEPRDSAFLARYKHVVFGTQLKGVKPTETMKLWKEDVKILFDSTVPPAHRRVLMKFAAEISSDIDSLNIYETNSRQEANYFIYYRGNEEEFDYEPRITNDHGGYYINWNKKQQINRAVLKLNTFFVKGDLRQVRVLKYYFLKSLGRFYTSSELPCESYFSDCSVNRKFTAMDKEILNYHYSYGICKGVNVETFEQLHQRMKERLKNDPNARLYLVHTEEEKE